MVEVVVYPNNSVRIDGYDVVWTEEDFKAHNISLVRYSNKSSRWDNRNIKEYEERYINGVRYIIWPNQLNKRGKVKKWLSRS